MKKITKKQTEEVVNMIKYREKYRTIMEINEPIRINKQPKKFYRYYMLEPRKRNIRVEYKEIEEFIKGCEEEGYINTIEGREIFTECGGTAYVINVYVYTPVQMAIAKKIDTRELGIKEAIEVYNEVIKHTQIVVIGEEGGIRALFCPKNLKEPIEVEACSKCGAGCDGNLSEYYGYEGIIRNRIEIEVKRAQRI